MELCCLIRLSPQSIALNCTIALFHSGGFGVDFSSLEVADIERSLGKVSRGLLQHGVTAYCPTLVTSSREYYHRVIPLIPTKKGGPEGAAVLGKT